MKEILYKVCIFLSLGVLVVACASRQEDTKTGEVTQRRDFPDFFLNPPKVEDQYVGLGMARLKDDSLSRSTALARARADIATQVSVSVQTMLTDYAQEAGTDDTQTLIFVENVSKAVANIELHGTVTKEQYPAKDGTWYVMVYFPKAAMLDKVSEVFTRNEDAAFAEFKAQEALKKLNAELASHPPKSAGMESPVNQDN